MNYDIENYLKGFPYRKIYIRVFVYSNESLFICQAFSNHCSVNSCGDQNMIAFQNQAAS